MALAAQFVSGHESTRAQFIGGYSDSEQTTTHVLAGRSVRVRARSSRAGIPLPAAQFVSGYESTRAQFISGYSGSDQTTTHILVGRSVRVRARSSRAGIPLPAPARVRGPMPRFKSTDIGALVARVERVPERYPVYEFSGKTFYETDRPG